MHRVSEKLTVPFASAGFAFMCSYLFVVFSFNFPQNPYFGSRSIFLVILATSAVIMLVVAPLLNRMREYERLLTKRDFLREYALFTDNEKLLEAMKVELCDNKLGKLPMVTSPPVIYAMFNVSAVRGILKNDLMEVDKTIQQYESRHYHIANLKRKLE